MIIPWPLAELAETRAAQVLLPHLLLMGTPSHRASGPTRSLRGCVQRGLEVPRRRETVFQMPDPTAIGANLQ